MQPRPSGATSMPLAPSFRFPAAILTSACRSRQHSALARPLRQKLQKGLDAIGFGRGLVPADAMDTREAHGQARFMACRAMHAVERDFEHEVLRDGTHRPEPIDGVIADPAVEPPQLFVSEAGIGFADRYQLILAPDAES